MLKIHIFQVYAEIRKRKVLVKKSSSRKVMRLAWTYNRGKRRRYVSRHPHKLYPRCFFLCVNQQRTGKESVFCVVFLYFSFLERADVRSALVVLLRICSFLFHTDYRLWVVLECWRQSCLCWIFFWRTVCASAYCHAFPQGLHFCHGIFCFLLLYNAICHDFVLALLWRAFIACIFGCFLWHWIHILLFLIGSLYFNYTVPYFFRLFTSIYFVMTFGVFIPTFKVICFLDLLSETQRYVGYK